MGLHGLDGEVQPSGDVLVAVAARQQEHDLLLARGQLVELPIGRAQLGIALQRVESEAGEPRGEHRVSVGPLWMASASSAGWIDFVT